MVKEVRDMGAKKEELTLEEMLYSLDEHIQELESGDISLEQSFQVYEKGMRLLKECNEKIDLVEKKVLELNADGSLQEM